MPEEAKSKRVVRARGGLRRLGIYAVVAAILAVGFWAFHGSVLGWGAVQAIEFFGREAGYRVEVSSASIRLGRPVEFGGVRVAAEGKAPGLRQARVGEIVLSFNPPWKWWGPSGRIVDRVAVGEASIALDFSDEEPPTPEPMQRLTDSEKRADASRLAWLFPRRIEIRDISCRGVWEGGWFVAEDLDAVFDEAHSRGFALRSLAVELGGRQLAFGPLEARTALRDGEFFLSNLALVDGVMVETLTLGLARPGGVGIDLHAAAFGGSVRGGAFFGEIRGEPGVDAAFWAAGIDLQGLSQFLGLEPEARGILGETRLTFRGNPARPADAEASLRLSAGELLWGERGWETLTLSASLQNRNLLLSDMRLQQAENLVSANGEVALSGDWADIVDSPFLLNVSASIRDMGSLAGLLGPPLDEVTGRMSLKAAVSGRGRLVDGFATLEASSVGFRGRAIESVRADCTFAAGEVEVGRVEIWSGGDRISAKGLVSLKSPHDYSASIDAEIADVGSYAWIPRDPLPVYSGGVRLHWQGDGHIRANSGAFELDLQDLVSDWTPEGLTGRLAGTYSPGNIYLGDIELEHGPLVLDLRATLARSGISLDDIAIGAGRKELAKGQAFLPFDPFALIENGGNLGEATVPNLETYLAFQTHTPLALEDLYALAGAGSAARGNLSVEAEIRGLPSALTADGKIRLSDIGMEGTDLPPGSAGIDLTAGEGYATIEGQWKPGIGEPVTLSARLPFGLKKDAEGRYQWIDSAGTFEARASLPPTDLKALQPFLGKSPVLAGTAQGEVVASGTVDKPQIRGQLDVGDASLDFGSQAPRIEQLGARVVLDGTRAVLQDFSGTVGAGPFAISGSVDFADPGNPQVDLRLTGQKLLLYRSPDFRLRTNIELTARGRGATGAVSGKVGLVGGRIFKRLEITPLIAPSPAERERPFVLPDFSDKVPPPFGDWTVDVRIVNDSPFTVAGNIATGEILPDLTLGGTLGNPVPRGVITIENARAFLPFTVLDIDRGEIAFRPENPWMPMLDVRGHSQAMEYLVQLYAFGPLSERNILLRSDPPLSEESIILLLTTGLVPEDLQGSGSGQTAIGQGSILLLRMLAREFHWHGLDVESLVNRLQVNTSPPQLPGDRTTLRARFRLWDEAALVSEQDHLGFYNVGATYRFRFR